MGAHRLERDGCHHHLLGLVNHRLEDFGVQNGNMVPIPTPKS
jgi:hypothetical protein